MFLIMRRDINATCKCIVSDSSKNEKEKSCNFRCELALHQSISQVTYITILINLVGYSLRFDWLSLRLLGYMLFFKLYPQRRGIRYNIRYYIWILIATTIIIVTTTIAFIVTTTVTIIACLYLIFLLIYYQRFP